MVRHGVLLAACMALASMISAVAVHVTVFRNGESTGGVPVDLSEAHVPSGLELAQYLSTLVPVDGLYLDETKTTTDTIGDRVFTGKGVLVSSFDDIEENDRLYIVGRGLHFVWPFVEFGHRVSLQSTQSPTGKPITLESFNDSPRVFLVHDFFTEEEADGLIERILSIDHELNKLQRSGVGPRQSGQKVHSSVRTSENAFDSESPIAVTINKRAFDLLRIGEFQGDMADGLQLLRYKQKQAYIPHNDYFSEGATRDWNWNPKSGGSNRFATVFLYLSNVTRGGQTVFPLANMPPGVAHSTPPTDDEMELFEKGSWEYKMVKQCYSKLASYPRKAHAVLFYSQKGNGEVDPMSEHGGCPVLEGTKWGANLWVWNKRRHGLDANKFSMGFANNLDVPVDLYWSTTFMAHLPPRTKMNFQTYDGHEWTFKDAEGNVLLVHRATSNAGDNQVVAVPAETQADDAASSRDDL
ncbi:hypothetical protein H310_12432 [Aphanomyces invadans]|uniref:Fe2OG dioxygenase domain-containing protein n=1 Tax=Aphanomyces invadans TaxID=157072 RepID=A0A024THM1_9STRA|nr:hypothetical protein H310_12432 [Aphanomyces invadans]ETV93665.1 hypothetical protein H310_12432 [Aphanomyces invadans]|eukprot:XP_008877706.1 hypothetical protein H310_12432 [Aphanomyces invadans]